MLRYKVRYNSYALSAYDFEALQLKTCLFIYDIANTSNSETMNVVSLMSELQRWLPEEGTELLLVPCKQSKEHGLGILLAKVRTIHMFRFWIGVSMTKTSSYETTAWVIEWLVIFLMFVKILDKLKLWRWHERQRLALDRSSQSLSMFPKKKLHKHVS